MSNSCQIFGQNDITNIVMNINVLIVDDEISSQEMLETLLSRIKSIGTIKKAFNVNDALSIILVDKPDLIFLDIEMPNKNGFELIHELQSLDVVIPIIFVTGFSEYAIKAIRHSALDYLLKPIEFEELQASLIRFLNLSKYEYVNRIDLLVNKIKNIRVKFKNRTGYTLIDPEDVLYCEADGNYTTLVLGGNDKEYVSMKISKVYQLLEANNNLVRLSRSLIVNKKYIIKVNHKKRTILLEKEEFSKELKIPRNKMKYLDSLFME